MSLNFVGPFDPSSAASGSIGVVIQQGELLVYNYSLYDIYLTAPSSGRTYICSAGMITPIKFAEGSVIWAWTAITQTAPTTPTPGNVFIEYYPVGTCPTGTYPAAITRNVVVSNGAGNPVITGGGSNVQKASGGPYTISASGDVNLLEIDVNPTAPTVYAILASLQSISYGANAGHTLFITIDGTDRVPANMGNTASGNNDYFSTELVIPLATGAHTIKLTYFTASVALGHDSLGNAALVVLS